MWGRLCPADTLGSLRGIPWRCSLAVCYRRQEAFWDAMFTIFSNKKQFPAWRSADGRLSGARISFFPSFFLTTSPRSALRPAPRLHHGLRAVPQRLERGGNEGGAAGGRGPSVGPVRRRARGDGASQSPAAVPPLRAAGGRRALGGVGECGGPEEGPDERNPTRAGQLRAEREMRRCGA